MLVAVGVSFAEPQTVYLDLMEAAVSAYSNERLTSYLDEVEREGVQEHGFPRLAANLGILVANGRCTARCELLRRMMTASCRDARKGRMPPKSGGNEFSVKELVLAVVELEKAGTFGKNVTDSWRADLAAVVAEDCYTQGRLKLGLPIARNWVVFAAASEQARLRFGFGGNPAFVEKYVADQLRWFDANGMYRDPHQPAVYDFVTRLQFMHILDWGFDGPSRAALEAQLEKSAEPTLAMLSACDEIPYGGRSNQFLHNQTFYAAVCEWYAARFAQRGDRTQAARFAAAARRAVKALGPWLAETPVSHVKNRYPREANGVYSETGDMGCERYAYFDKYMVTMGSWALAARCFASAQTDDLPLPAPAVAPAVFQTTSDFHFTFLSAGDYSAQFDYDADTHYDSDGLGRLQRRGAPSTICLSTPCGQHPNYRIEGTNDAALAFVPCAAGDGRIVPVAACVTNGAAVATWRLPGRPDLAWSCTLTDKGLTSVLTGDGSVALTLPAFDFDGREKTRISASRRQLAVSYRGWTCVYETDGEIVDTGRSACNRNGRYRRFEARGRNAVKVVVRIERERRAVPSPEEKALAQKLPEIFAKSADHYRALDAAATPLMKDEDGALRAPHGILAWKTGRNDLNMSSIYGWTAGHFPGSLWYLYEATGDSFFRDRATVWTEILAPNAKVTDNHDVGFIMFCSYGNARRLLKTDRYDELLLEAAASLSRRYNGNLGLIRSWGALDEEKDFLVIPDNLMNLELLAWASRQKGGERFGRFAVSHADVTMRHHFRADGSCYHVLDYDQNTGRVKEIRRGQGASCETAWSRGQSWGIYGYTMMYRVTRQDRYLSFAQKLADYAISHPNMPADGIPFWDYGAPGEERDASAAAVMASALVELASFVGGEKAASYRAFAAKQLLSLSSSEYFSQGDEIGHFLLKHGVGNKPKGGEVDTPLDYGDYYFLEALVRFGR